MIDDDEIEDDEIEDDEEEEEMEEEEDDEGEMDEEMVEIEEEEETDEEMEDDEEIICEEGSSLSAGKSFDCDAMGDGKRTGGLGGRREGLGSTALLSWMLGTEKETDARRYR